MPKRTMQSTSADYWGSKNKTIQRILCDFPWLWAIHSCWSCHQSDMVKVSQDMQDLKLALSQQSMITSFTFWALTVEPCELMNERIREITRLENITWAEAIEKQTLSHLSIVYLFLVGSPTNDYADSEIIIFRNPNKTGFDDIVKTVIQLQGSITQRPSVSM